MPTYMRFPSFAIENDSDFVFSFSLHIKKDITIANGKLWYYVSKLN